MQAIVGLRRLPLDGHASLARRRWFRPIGSCFSLSAGRESRLADALSSAKRGGPRLAYGRKRKATAILECEEMVPWDRVTRVDVLRAIKSTTAWGRGFCPSTVYFVTADAFAGPLLTSFEQLSDVGHRSEQS